jgi:hypothetical protein
MTLPEKLDELNRKTHGAGVNSRAPQVLQIKDNYTPFPGKGVKR